MRKVLILKNTDGYKEGDVVFVNGNDAHRLIDLGKGQLYYEDKMMRPETMRVKKRRYKIK